MRVAVSLLALTTAVAAERFSWKKLEGGRLELRERNAPVLVMNVGSRLPDGVPQDRRRCCYVHPLYSPSGIPLTDDFPKDHYHHRGLFWAWPLVATPESEYDLWLLRGIRPEPEKVLYREGGATGRLSVSSVWVAAGKRIVREIVTFMVLPSEGGVRRIDLKLTLEALSEPVTLGGSREKGKAYGGLSLRFAPRLRTMMHTSEGVAGKDEDLMPHNWAALEGVYNSGHATVRIEPSGANPEGPNAWCLRAYGFLNPSFPGPGRFTLAPGKPLALRYFITIADTRESK